METDTLRADHGPVTTLSMPCPPGRALDLAGTQRRPVHSAFRVGMERGLRVWSAPGTSRAMATGSLQPCFLSCLDRFSFGLAPIPAWPARPLVLFQRVLFQMRRLLHLGYASARVRL